MLMRSWILDLFLESRSPLIFGFEAWTMPDPLPSAEDRVGMFST